MATRIRLRRTGKKKQAYYRVVVADSRSPRDGRFIEVLGNYNPNTKPAQVEINEERALYWLASGAKPTDTVRSLLSKKGILAKLAEQKPDHAVLKRPQRRKRPVAEVEAPRAETAAEGGMEEEITAASVEESTLDDEAVERPETDSEAESTEGPSEGEKEE